MVTWGVIPTGPRFKGAVEQMADGSHDAGSDGVRLAAQVRHQERHVTRYRAWQPVLHMSTCSMARLPCTLSCDMLLHPNKPSSRL